MLAYNAMISVDFIAVSAYNVMISVDFITVSAYNVMISVDFIAVSAYNAIISIDFITALTNNAIISTDFITVSINPPTLRRYSGVIIAFDETKIQKIMIPAHFSCKKNIFFLAVLQI